MEVVYFVFRLIFSLLGLGFLVLIHELGHYFMAKRVGMKVDIFSIGLGKPIFAWYRGGVKWQICILPFGGYVKIVDMEPVQEEGWQKQKSAYFRPIDKIKVYLAGPLVNIIFACLIFTLIWMTGGTEKSFSFFTHRIGWIDPHSELYERGVRPGDSITSYNQHPLKTVRDHLSAPMFADSEIQVAGDKIDYYTNQKTPFDYLVNTYPHPEVMKKNAEPGFMTSGILEPANYLFYMNAASDQMPIAKSGIQKYDRILWVDGYLIFSIRQLNHVINESEVLLTVERNHQILLRRVPRIRLIDLRLSQEEKAELLDWQHEAELRGKWQQLFFIPYAISASGDVEKSIPMVDLDQGKGIEHGNRDDLHQPLLPGDRIIAVSGEPALDGYDILSRLQTKKVQIIVDRNPSLLKRHLSWETADEEFDKNVNFASLNQITHTLGTTHPIRDMNDLHVLNSIEPISQKQVAEQMKIQLPNHMLSDDYVLGISQWHGLTVEYNPPPYVLFVNVFDDVYRTLKALLMGNLSPKWMSGPVGIIQVIHYSWMISIKEALFLIGVISFNLGLFNLLPLPVLDGGNICLNIIEMLIGKPIAPKLLEKLIFPFVILLVGLMIFMTYNDISRILRNWFT